jgi:DNA-binding NarL/FixJ family response regulator
MADPGSVGPRSVARGFEAELSRQDVELLGLLARGLPLDAVARRLNTSERTVRRRVKAICDRLGVTASIEAVVWAARQGLV